MTAITARREPLSIAAGHNREVLRTGLLQAPKRLAARRPRRAVSPNFLLVPPLANSLTAPRTVVRIARKGVLGGTLPPSTMMLSTFFLSSQTVPAVIVVGGASSNSESPAGHVSCLTGGQRGRRRPSHLSVSSPDTRACNNVDHRSIADQVVGNSGEPSLPLRTAAVT